MSNEVFLARTNKVKVDAEAVRFFLAEAGTDQIRITGSSENLWRKMGVVARVRKPVSNGKTVAYDLIVKTIFNGNDMTIVSKVDKWVLAPNCSNACHTVFRHEKEQKHV